jgi:hypothetical protein
MTFCYSQDPAAAFGKPVNDIVRNCAQTPGQKRAGASPQSCL